MMSDFIQYQAPLYGRLTAQSPLYLLCFADGHAFLQRNDSWQRLDDEDNFRAFVALTFEEVFWEWFAAGLSLFVKETAVFPD